MPVLLCAAAAGVRYIFKSWRERATLTATVVDVRENREMKRKKRKKKKNKTPSKQ